MQHASLLRPRCCPQVITTPGYGLACTHLHEYSASLHLTLNSSPCPQVIITPGYGLAVAGGQYAIAELARALRKKGVNVRRAARLVVGRAGTAVRWGRALQHCG